MDKIKLIEAILSCDSKQTISNNDFWEIGKDYVVRTVTMIYLGKLKDYNSTELLLEDCAWIPETSRWNEFLTGKKPNEMEPYANDVIVGRGALLDATLFKEKLKREVI